MSPSMGEMQESVRKRRNLSPEEKYQIFLEVTHRPGPSPSHENGLGSEVFVGGGPGRSSSLILAGHPWPAPRAGPGAAVLQLLGR